MNIEGDEDSDLIGVLADEPHILSYLDLAELRFMSSVYLVRRQLEQARIAEYNGDMVRAFFFQGQALVTSRKAIEILRHELSQHPESIPLLSIRNLQGELAFTVESVVQLLVQKHLPGSPSD
jgi:hypothetical protein